MKKPNPLLEDLKPLLPAIAANASRAEQLRQVPDENIALLKSIGLHRAFQPKAFGGLELSLPEFADCIALLAGSCASTAWAMSLLCTHSHQLALFSAQLQEEIWGANPDATASSSIAPFGRVTEGEGGVYFSGEMGWSSGCDHGEWAIVGCRRQNAEGTQDYCFAVLPRSDYQIRDDWFAAGMKGSGTKTLRCKNYNCPAKRLKRFARFVSKTGMDIDGLSIQTLLAFVNKGFLRDYDDIYRLDEHAEDIRQMEGMGEKSYLNLRLEQLRIEMRQTEARLYRLMP